MRDHTSPAALAAQSGIVLGDDEFAWAVRTPDGHITEHQYRRAAEHCTNGAQLVHRPLGSTGEWYPAEPRLTSRPANPADTDPSTELVDQLARAIADPGKILPRTPGESVARWGARAVESVLAAADKEFTDGQVAQANILGWNMNAGLTDLQISIALETAAGLVGVAKTFLTATGAENYVEQHVHDRETGERYTLTIQRPGMKTPHELRRKAESEADRFRDQRNRVGAVLNSWQATREQQDGTAFAEFYDRIEAALSEQEGQHTVLAQPEPNWDGSVL